MFIEFRPSTPKPRSETRSDLRIALVAILALTLLILLLPEADSSRRSSTVVTSAPASK